ncbi:MAG: acyl transferase [Bacteroidota bacterium]
MNDLAQVIFSSKLQEEFDKNCLTIFHHQAVHCEIYRRYISHLGIEPNDITEVSKIPYLPISFFKTHKILSNSNHPQLTFTSSGTTGMAQSKHFVTDQKLYDASFLTAFNIFYGSVRDYCILALLPSYQERDGSSLIYMVDALIEETDHPDSGYFLYNHSDLFDKLERLKSDNQKTILIGVTYALLDFIEQYSISFPELIIMETGGMKGKRKEMVREELHQILTTGFGVSSIHSEYGMTELLSQAYSTGEGIFNCPPWMMIKLRDTNDPLSLISGQKTGGINVIDLANLNSCSFIATQDLGKLYPDNSFEVLGRFDNSDIRGCNLLVQ